jgi:hypothetical protein
MVSKYSPVVREWLGSMSAAKFVTITRKRKRANPILGSIVF